MPIFYHGTSIRAATDIARHGFLSDRPKNWTVSDDGVYFWSPDELSRIEECDEDYRDDFALQKAYQNAQCMLSTERGDCRAVVFAVELNDDEVEADFSCTNMAGAVVYYGDIPPDRIRSVYISPDLSLIRGYFIMIAKGLDLFAGEFTEIEDQVADLFENMYVETVEDEFPLETTHLANLFLSLSGSSKRW